MMNPRSSGSSEGSFDDAVTAWEKAAAAVLRPVTSLVRVVANRVG